jgi:hypothetical protein
MNSEDGKTYSKGRKIRDHDRERETGHKDKSEREMHEERQIGIMKKDGKYQVRERKERRKEKKKERHRPHF